MNEVFLDTETTGLSFKEGHKIVEIACIETKELIPTGKVFHKLINPQRDVPDTAFKIHGFSIDFLSSIMIFTVSLVSLLVIVFSFDYMKSDPFFCRFISYLNFS